MDYVMFHAYRFRLFGYYADLTKHGNKYIVTVGQMGSKDLEKCIEFDSIKEAYSELNELCIWYRLNYVQQSCPFGSV